VAGATALLVGLAPAIQASRGELVNGRLWLSPIYGSPHAAFLLKAEATLTMGGTEAALTMKITARAA
jgi:hypothetical protein